MDLTASAQQGPEEFVGHRQDLEPPFSLHSSVMSLPDVLSKF